MDEATSSYGADGAQAGVGTTAGEQLVELFRRTSRLSDRVAALLDPQWGASVGLLPEGHPLHPGSSQAEQAADINWRAIARRRETELKTEGEYRNKAEAALARVRALAERWRYTGDRKDGPLSELLIALGEEQS